MNRFPSSRIRPATKMRTSARITLWVSGFMATALVLLLSIFSQMESTDSEAAVSSMIFETADAVQDTSPILRGSMNQPVIRLAIKISGKGIPVSLNSVTFSAKGTSQPVASNLMNARLWYCGSEKIFSTRSQFGSTVLQVTDQPFEITGNNILKSGMNYFWLTFDLKPDAVSINGFADAECIQLRIGSTDYIPLTSSPPGLKKIQNNIPFYSTGNGLAENPETWNSRRDGAGTSPKNFSDPRNSFFVQPGHRLKTARAFSVPQLLIEKAAQFVSDSLHDVSRILISEGGLFMLTAPPDSFASIRFLEARDGGTLVHDHWGSFPIENYVFHPASNLVFSKCGANSLPENLVCGNLYFRLTEPSNVDLSGKLKQVKGNLTIENKSGSSLYFSGQDSLFIQGDFILKSGTFSGSENGSCFLAIENNLEIQSGVFSNTPANKNGSMNLSIGGNLNIKGGNIELNQGKIPAMLKFHGSKNKSVSWYSEGTRSAWCNINIEPGKELILKCSEPVEIPASCQFKVRSFATLQCANSIINGSGSFELESNATLGIGSRDGISSLENKGNIQTAQRIFNSGSHYVFNSTSSLQYSGIFTTTPEENTVQSIRIQKHNPNDEVVMMMEIKSSVPPIVTSGKLHQDSNRIISKNRP